MFGLANGFHLNVVHYIFITYYNI
ncbi:hypothetical protein E2C01_070981 [Portunus trituberculatus]|uniref:Uncharacterized protein n=1 Tax=Portunus trituberculatus TaxID=210409 RepID=A0A5B7I340_PORTR|nr:hypothetical protein [Portunus trituberculatus]